MQGRTILEALAVAHCKRAKKDLAAEGGRPTC